MNLLHSQYAVAMYSAALFCLSWLVDCRPVVIEGY